MDDIKDKIKTNSSSIVQPIKLGSKLNSFHQQVAKAANAPAMPTASQTGGFANMSTTIIFPDCSGSMGRYNDSGKINILLCIDAVNSFIDNCFLGATKIGVATFPERVVEPTAELSSVKRACELLHASGGTPMLDPLDYVISAWPTITHGIVISDGLPDDPDEVLQCCKVYKSKNVKLDAVHIGDEDEEGETLMKNIAEITGGIYIKFTDVDAFAKNFKFLTPKYRLQLATSKNPIALLGASEVKI